MADKGFTIAEELGKIRINLNIPPFVSSGSQLSQADVSLTHKIAQHRIHVERAIRRIRFLVASPQVCLHQLTKFGLFVLC